MTSSLDTCVQSLLCWDVRTPKAPVLICSFSACHRDWVTGCAWTKDSLLVSEGVGMVLGSAGFLGEGGQHFLPHPIPNAHL